MNKNSNESTLSPVLFPPSSTVTAKKGNKESNFFEWVLVITVMITLCLGSYESYMQKYRPPNSILNYLHMIGYLKEYPVVYEPGKGIWHLFGWIGSGMMVVMMLYSVRKRLALSGSLGSMRHWLAAHMFLGIMGPLLITLHTTFKFGGIIATSFWCMIVTMVFGILGRYIYVQIPRSISGAELGVKDIDKIIENLDRALGRYLSTIDISDSLDEISSGDSGARHIHPIRALLFIMKTDIKNRFRIYRIRGLLKTRYHLTRKARKEIVFHLKKRAALISRKNFLTISHSLLRYWHVLHVPLAIVMFSIMFLHIIVYYLFRVSH